VSTLTAAIGKASPQGLAASKALTTAPILADFDKHADELTEQSAHLFGSDEEPAKA
jgi:enoyl-CoA hydratase